MIDSKLKSELVRKYGTEQVFVVPYHQAKRIPDKFTPAQNIKVSVKSWEGKGKYILRYDAEYNVSVQQLIPYILVTDMANSKVYVTKRMAGEERLKGSLSLGCGGHINPVDAGDIIINAALREMNEELNVELKNEQKPLAFVGYVRDLTSPTNDHLGLVFKVAARKVSVKETDNLAGRWMDLSELVAKYSNFESWARHIIDYLYLTHSFDKIFI